jgi:predicted amidohydrolase YtcJ
MAAGLAALASAVPVLLGSDWPTLPLDPLSGIAELTGTEDNGKAGEPAIRLARGVEAATIGAAWAAFDDTRKGTLTPGMLADVIVLSTDIFGQPVTPFHDAVVTTTIFDGKVVYSREPTNAPRARPASTSR